MKKINVMLRKCKTLSKPLGRSSSFSGLGSKSARHQHHHDGAGGGGGIIWNTNVISVYGSEGNGSSGGEGDGEEESSESVFVGSSRKRYVISSKCLSHPLVNALAEKSKLNEKSKPVGDDDVSVINCEKSKPVGDEIESRNRKWFLKFVTGMQIENGFSPLLQGWRRWKMNRDGEDGR